MKTKNKACIRCDGVSFLSEPSSPNRCANTLDATNPQIVTDLRKGGFGVESVSSVDEKRVKRSIDECEPSTAQLNFNSICLDSMLLEHRQSVNVNRTGNKNTKDESPFRANLPHEPSQHQVPDVPTFTGFPNVPVVLDFELGVIRSAASSSMPMNRPIFALNSESHKRKPAPNDVVREYYNTYGSHKRSRRQAYLGNRCPQIDPEFTETRHTTAATGPPSEYKAFGPCKCVCLHLVSFYRKKSSYPKMLGSLLTDQTQVVFL